MDPRRMISTRTWADPWFEELNTESKLLWLYLLTNQQTNLIGIYEISIKRISNETGINLTGCQTVMDGFANRSKIIWNGSHIVICNFLKHQSLANPNMEKSARKIFDSLPDTVKKLLQSHGINDFKQFLNGFPNQSQTHADGFGEREREREREIERERETANEKKQSRPSGLVPEGLIPDDYLETHRSFRVDAFPEGEEETENQETATKELDEPEQIEVQLWPSFEDFWNTYDKKRGDILKVKKKWDTLKQLDKESVMAYIPTYKQAQPDKQFRKDPSTFLNNKSWNDEIISAKSTNLIQSGAAPSNPFERLFEKVNRSSAIR